MHILHLFIIGITILPLLIDGLPLFHRGRPRDGMLGSLKRRFQSSFDPKSSLNEELWYTQELDHFNLADTRTRHAPNPGKDRESRVRCSRVRSFPGSVIPGTGNPGFSHSHSCSRSDNRVRER